MYLLKNYIFSSSNLALPIYKQQSLFLNVWIIDAVQIILPINFPFP